MPIIGYLKLQSKNYLYQNHLGNLLKHQIPWTPIGWGLEGLYAGLQVFNVILVHTEVWKPLIALEE